MSGTILTLLDFVDPTTGLAWLTRADVDAVMGPKRVDELTCDDGTSRVNTTTLYTVLAKAEQKVVSVLLRAYSAPEIVTMMKNDQFARSSSADIAAEYLSRRKGDFASEDGKGRYYTPYKEACDYFDKVSHGRTETAAPISNAQEGGNVRPPLEYPEQPYIFAPNTQGRNFGRGGF